LTQTNQSEKRIQPFMQGNTIMNRTTKWMMTLAVLAGGMMTQQVMAQQVVQPAPTQVREVQPTRSYRSFSVNPARGDVRRNGPHSGDATWRHAGAKPAGHYANGR
jgi:hypothetical protein